MNSATALDLRTLVLNADGRALSTWPLSLVPGIDAVRAVFKGSANVLEEWDAVLRSPSTIIRVPKVIMLRSYAPISASPKFCRRSILLRDRYCCCYCGHRFPSEDLTFDHVIPKSNGGQTVWENILSCCIDCNARKRDRPANWSGKKGGDSLRPLKAPRQPTTAELLRAGLEFLDDALRETWGDYLYWGVELKA